MSSTLEASVLMGKNYSENVHSIQNTWKDLTLQQMQFLACKGLCIFGFCVMFWKGESEPSIKYCLGRTAKLVQRFTTIQNVGHN